MRKNLVPIGKQACPAEPLKSMPAIIVDAGKPALTAWHDFFSGKLPNENTRTAYTHAIRRFCDWAQHRGLRIEQIRAGDVGDYFREHPGSTSTKKQHLSGLRRFFNLLVERHICLLNPALVAELEKLSQVEGKTPEITPEQTERLMRSISTKKVTGLRDLAIIGILAGTAARAGAVAKLRKQDLYQAGEQWMLHFQEKRNKSREIPLRLDLVPVIVAYMKKAGLEEAPKKAPLFRTAIRKEDRLTDKAVTSHDICRMVKRRVVEANLPGNLSAHSFRVGVATDLFRQKVDTGDIQYLLGHADPRTTRLYDRTAKTVTRNLVDRIRIIMPQVRGG